MKEKSFLFIILNSYFILSLMAILRLTPNTPGYPAGLPAYVAALGNPDLLARPALALFCSVKCPGSLILQTYDLAQKLRERTIPMIGGFHSPIEKECLTILLRGPGPVVICPARSLEGMRLPAEWQGPLEQGRLLLLSPFAEKQRRPTLQTAQARNRFVAALAAHIFISYAAPGGKTEQFGREIIGWGKPVFTFDHPANATLIEMGVRAISNLEDLKPITLRP